jgi:uncharacterized protein
MSIGAKGFHPAGHNFSETVKAGIPSAPGASLGRESGMIVHRSFIVPLWVALGLAAGVARAVTVDQIPSPRPLGWTVDLTGTLPAETVAELNRLGDDVKARTGAELAVAVVGSTDGADPRDFANRLFNHWGIGEEGKKNGLLVFAALDDRKSEIVLGSGVDSTLNTQVSEEVMQGEMVPRFRAGDPAGAILQGARACAWRILASPVAAPEPLATSEPSAVPEPLAALPPVQNPVASVPSEGAPAAAWVFLLFALGGFGAIVAGLVAVLRPRRCSQCGQKMELMDEASDDAHLDSAEQVEERIGSVDHQIWVCPGCGQTEKVGRSRWFSGYKECPRCLAKTLSSTSTTLEYATYDSGGLIRVDKSCANCPYTDSYTRITPRLERPREDDERWSSSSSSWSSSSSSSFSSSSSDSSSSSSSSSGSGFGGGSSSGRGASGSW